MTDLSRAAVSAVDPLGMLDDVLAQPAQIEDALWRFESAGASGADAAGGLVVCGMGGSAIGGDLASACIGDRARRPIRTVRGYRLEPWTASDTLVLFSSYSGQTEEVLACWEQARELGTRRLALTTGGRLAELARAEGVPVVGVPAGLQPRAAVIYMTVGALEAATACGAAPSLRSELEAAGRLLADLALEWGPDGPDECEPKDVARRLVGAVPVVYGAGATAAVARRWKTQLNENAKAAAFFSEVPEANHNEICGLDTAADVAPLHPILLHGAGGDERLGRRLMLTAMLASGARLRADGVTARGQSLTEQVLSLVLCGDLTSVYLAALRGVDPTPVAAIEDFKHRLEEGGPGELGGVGGASG